MKESRGEPGYMASFSKEANEKRIDKMRPQVDELLGKPEKTTSIQAIRERHAHDDLNLILKQADDRVARRNTELSRALENEDEQKAA
jgi:hypothetical protein